MATGMLDRSANFRPGDRHAVSGEQDRPFGGSDEFRCFLQPVGRRMDRRMVAQQLEFRRFDDVGFGDLNVLAEIDHHRARAPAAGDIEGLMDRTRHIVRRGDQEVVLCDRQADAGHVDFLECIRPEVVAGHLAGDEYHR
jgi:hypothetical protein